MVISHLKIGISKKTFFSLIIFLSEIGKMDALKRQFLLHLSLFITLLSFFQQSIKIIVPRPLFRLTIYDYFVNFTIYKKLARETYIF